MYVMRFLKQRLFSSMCQLKNKVQKNPLLFWFILASFIFPLTVNKTVPFVGLCTAFFFNSPNSSTWSLFHYVTTRILSGQLQWGDIKTKYHKSSFLILNSFRGKTKQNCCGFFSVTFRQDNNLTKGIVGSHPLRAPQPNIKSSLTPKNT